MKTPVKRKPAPTYDGEEPVILMADRITTRTGLVKPQRFKLDTLDKSTTSTTVQPIVIPSPSFTTAAPNLLQRRTIQLEPLCIRPPPPTITLEEEDDDAQLSSSSLSSASSTASFVSAIFSPPLAGEASDNEDIPSTPRSPSSPPCPADTDYFLSHPPTRPAKSIHRQKSFEPGMAAEATPKPKKKLASRSLSVNAKLSRAAFFSGARSSPLTPPLTPSSSYNGSNLASAQNDGFFDFEKRLINAEQEFEMEVGRLKKMISQVSLKAREAEFQQV